MPSPSIRLDHAGIGAMLKSHAVAAAIAERAIAVRSAVAGHESVRRNKMRVRVRFYETDRAAAAVTIAHPGGLAVEAKYGALVKAAADADLEVTETDEEHRLRTARRKKAREHRDRLKRDADYAREHRKRREVARLKRAERERERLREDDV